MQQYVLIAALLACRVAGNVNRRVKMITDVDNNLQPKGMNANPKLFRLSITRSPRPITSHRSEQPLELSCEAYGLPAPAVRWFRNHNPIYEHDIESNELLTANPTSVGRISSTILITKPRDQDVFTCVASNGFLTTKASTTILTSGLTENTERLKLFPLAPRILTTYYALADVIGNTVVLPCKAKGHPKPKITWILNDRVVKNDPRMRVLSSGELVISPLHLNDSGEVICVAENIFGNTSVSTIIFAAVNRVGRRSK